MRRGRVLLAAAAALAVLAAIAGGVYYFVLMPSSTIAVSQSEQPTTGDGTGVDQSVSDNGAGENGGSNPADNSGGASRPRPVKYDDWQLSCDTPPGASFPQCAVIQNVTAEDQPNVGLSVIVLKTADNQARLLRVLAPLGVLLPSGLGLNIDGTDMGKVAFVRCLPNGCVAEVVIDDTLLATLSNGTSAIFIVFKTPEEGIGIPVSLKGFKQSFAALP